MGMGKGLRLAIQKARTAKGLSQKQLAQQLNMQPQVINEYESGKAIPNNAIIAKIERALGAKLPRPVASLIADLRRKTRALPIDDLRNKWICRVAADLGHHWARRWRTLGPVFAVVLRAALTIPSISNGECNATGFCEIHSERC